MSPQPSDARETLSKEGEEYFVRLQLPASSVLFYVTPLRKVASLSAAGVHRLAPKSWVMDFVFFL
jgi:hypothetical protein